MTEEDSVSELVERARRGNRASFGTLVARHEAYLREFVRSRIRTGLAGRLSLDELTTETFARAFESLDRFHGTTEDSFRGWLVGIAKHVVLKEVDRVRRGSAFQIPRELADESPSPSKILARDERFDRLKEALKALSPDHRQVVLLCRIEGLPIREVAARMGRSPDAVKKLLWRALKALKNHFGETDSLHLPDRQLRMEGEADGK